MSPYKSGKKPLRNCIAMCEWNSQSYMFLFSDLFVNTVFWKSAIRYFIAQWSLKWKRKYPLTIAREKLSERLLSVTSSHRVPPFLSWNSLLTLLSWILQSDIWDPIGTHGEKRSIVTYELERSFLRDCFLICDFITQSCTLPFLNSLLTLLSWILQSDIGNP